MNRSESIKAIAAALVACRKDLKQPTKTATNPFLKNKYVPLEGIINAIDAVAPKHGLTYTQWALNDDHARTGVQTLLMHDSGEFIEYDPHFMGSMTADAFKPQEAGSVITYGRRYQLAAIFGLASDEDDDGNQSSGVTQSRANTQKVGKAAKVSKVNLEIIKDLFKELETPEEGMLKLLAAYKVDKFGELTPVQAEKLTKQLQDARVAKSAQEVAEAVGGEVVEEVPFAYETEEL